MNIVIADGVSMQVIGVGTWQLADPDVLFNILDNALSCGYRLIDTAASYGNEKLIGGALKTLLPKYSLKREDVFITTKLHPVDQGTGKARAAALKSLQNLQCEYLDLYLIHFPGVGGLNVDNPEVPKRRAETWRDLETLLKEGKIRAIGVSNYQIRHLVEMKSYSTIVPSVNQCEFHPYLVCSDLRDYCTKNGIHFQAYSSLGSHRGKGNLFAEPVVLDLAEKYHCSVPQLLLAFALNQGISVLPRTKNVEHLRNNFKATDIHISDDDLCSLSKLSVGLHYCWKSDDVI